MTPLRLIPAALVVLLIAVLVPGSATGAKQRGVHPGVQTYTKGGQCTANFLFRRGDTRYIGQAAHCSGKGEAMDTNGCKNKSQPLGTKVKVGNATRKGEIAYSSWVAMRRAGEPKSSVQCKFNDFALVELGGPAARKAVPTVPYFGGPTGLAPSSSSKQAGDPVYSYGHSSLRPDGEKTLRRKSGVVTSTSGKGWSRTVRTDSPGVPGDSGSPFLDGDGRALGTLSTVALFPDTASNGVADLHKEVEYARKHGMPGLELIEGRKPFDDRGMELPGLPFTAPGAP